MYLNCHSYHSLRYGTIPVEDLALQAKSCQAEAVALTDVNATAGVYNFVLACRESGIKPLVGIDFRVGGIQVFVGLAKNRNGYGELCRLLTWHNRNKAMLTLRAPELSDVIIIYPVDNIPEVLRENEFIGMRPEHLNKLTRSSLSGKVSKMVILAPVTIRGRKEFNLHRILRAVDKNIIFSRLAVSDICSESEQMIPLGDLLLRYQQFPVIIKNTERIVADCNFDFDFGVSRNKKHYTNSRYSDRLLLETLAYEGLQRRYGDCNKEAAARVKKELDVIDALGFSSYFLITWDIIRYSNSRGFMHIGRGSGANSIVSYCLGITDICPIELNLYFERFLNSGRTSPPDFDIDWSWQDRDTILGYIFKRFDTNHVAFVGTNVQFKYRSIVRELGKVFGLAKTEMDALVHVRPELRNMHKVMKCVHDYGLMLEKYPNQRSMHACGILISEEPITNFTVLELPPKGFPTAQMDMHIAERIGFEKFDILSQRGIGHINDCVKLVLENRGERVDIRNVNICKDETRANAYLEQGNTLGCFYVESPAMRGLLRRLKCNSYTTLVAASSVIRPGVAQSGMMREYVFRHNNPGKFEYFHSVFREQLGETYGVMVYQEDVIKIAHHFAGLNLSDADILRRAMSGKTRSKEEFDGVKDHFFKNCTEKGYPDSLSREVYRQIESFAGYSFCKAHSASYAVESYQSLYLKVYYPIEFMVAVINNFGGFYRTEVYFHEAKMAGADICNPCVNLSTYLTSVKGKEVYIGFVHIQNLEEGIARRIPEEREQNGAYLSLEDFINRVPVEIESVQVLICLNAFRFTGKEKNELMLLARMLIANFRPGNGEGLLIKESCREYVLPKLLRAPHEDAFDEIELLGFPVSCSPFDLLKTKYRGAVMTRDLLCYSGKTVRMVGYLISRKFVPTKNGLMNFGTWIDVQGEYFDTTHFPACLSKYPFQGGGCYLLQGRVDVDFNFPSVVVEKMGRLSFLPDPRYEGDTEHSYKVHQKIKEDLSTSHRAPYPAENETNLPRQKMRSNAKAIPDNSRVQ